MSGFNKQFIKHYEGEVKVIDGYVALDGSSDVLPAFPVLTTTAVTSGQTYTRVLGAQGAIGAGTIITQPHTTTGVYVFTFDDPSCALIGCTVTPAWDVHSANALQWGVILANVTGSSTGVVGGDAGLLAGNLPGNDPSGTLQTATIKFAGTTGTLTDPPVSTGFWVHFTFKRTAQLA